MLKVIFFQNDDDIASLSAFCGGMEKPANILIALFFCRGDLFLRLCVCVCVCVPYNFFLFYLGMLSL